jgi:hypothetical protein
LKILKVFAMKIIPVFLFAAMIALSGCSSAYQSAQTPDDVYYSPGQQYASRSQSDNQGEYYNANPNDQYLMMKVHDPARWSAFDDYSYDAFYYPYSGVGFGYGGYYGGFSPWNSFGFWNPYYGLSSYYAWNAFYNPYYYYCNGGYVGGKNSTYNTYSGLHPINVAAYRNNAYSNTNSRYYSSNNNSFNRNGNSFNNNTFRRSYFNNQNNNNFNRNNFNNNRSFSQPTRSYSPSSSFGSGGGGGSRGGGGGGFSRPGKP